MTIDELIAEGRRLQRRTILLTPDGSGEPAAIWYGHDYSEESPDDHRCWLSVDASIIPSFDGQGWLSILTDDKSCAGGRVDQSASRPARDGVALYPKEITVLPPINAVITRG